MTSAGYTAFEDDGAVERTAKTGKGNQSCGIAHGTERLGAVAEEDRAGRPGASQADHPGVKNSKNKSFVVQRAEYLAPFPPKIMRTLLPSFIDVDPSVRPDKAPRPSFPDPGKHGDVKSNTSLRKGHCHKGAEKVCPAPPPQRQIKPVHWEDMQSCLLPAFYSFSSEDHRAGDRAGRPCCDLGEVI